MKRVGRVLRALVLIYGVTFVCVMLWQYLWPSPQTLPARADAIICLGAGMEDDTSPLPDAVSRARALTCADLHARGVAPLVVFTGAGHDGGSAAESMAVAAAEAGMPKEAIVVEPFAHSTLQNAAFARALLPGDTERLVIVSDAFHLPRAWVIFRVLGEDQISLYATEMSRAAPLTRLRWSLREGIVIWVNALRLAVYASAGAIGIDRDTRIIWFN